MRRHLDPKILETLLTVGAELAKTQPRVVASHVVKEMAKRGMLISLSAASKHLQLNGFNVSDGRPKGQADAAPRQRVSPHRDAVLTLWRGGMRNQSEIARTLDCERATVSKLLKHARREGLISDGA